MNGCDSVSEGTIQFQLNIRPASNSRKRRTRCSTVLINELLDLQDECGNKMKIPSNVYIRFCTALL
jgi:hypothetical protein